MRVASYNIHDGIGLDGEFRLDRIARFIGAMNVDLIGLQEVPRYLRAASGLDSIRALAEATGMYGAFAPSYTWYGVGPVGSESGKGLEWPQYGNGLLSRYPIRWVETHPLPYCETRGAYVERRGLLEALIAGPEQDFMVMVTHLGLDAYERQQQVEEISARMRAVGRPLIFMGDCNSEPTSDPIVTLTRTLTVVPVEVAPGWTFPAASPDRQLDYIFVRGFVIQRNLFTRASDASDHLPVLAELDLEK